MWTRLNEVKLFRSQFPLFPACIESTNICFSIVGITWYIILMQGSKPRSEIKLCSIISRPTMCFLTNYRQKLVVILHNNYVIIVRWRWYIGHRVLVVKRLNQDLIHNGVITEYLGIEGCSKTLLTFYRNVPCYEGIEISMNVSYGHSDGGKEFWNKITVCWIFCQNRALFSDSGNERILTLTKLDEVFVF